MFPKWVEEKPKRVLPGALTQTGWWPEFGHVTALTEFVDPYLDSETDVLRNKIGAQTQTALDEAEFFLTKAMTSCAKGKFGE